MVPGAAIHIDRLSIDLGGQCIVGETSLDVAPGEFVCLLGPSGCGKSTLLNVMAGFLPAQGRVTVGGVPVTGPGVDRGVVFQSAEALFPWLTVTENVMYGPRLRGLSRKDCAAKARHYIDMVGLTHAAHKFPRELSGGMRRRAQIARVLVNEPSVILMDEPFGALDAQTREVMQREVDRIRRAAQATVVFVTHDIWEAIVLGDRVITMTAGPQARIKSDIRVDLPAPRDQADPDAIRLYSTIRDGIAAEVDKVMRRQGLAREVAA